MKNPFVIICLHFIIITFYIFSFKIRENAVSALFKSIIRLCPSVIYIGYVIDEIFVYRIKLDPQRFFCKSIGRCQIVCSKRIDDICLIPIDKAL